MSEEKWVFIIDDTDNSASQSSYSSEKERLENIEDLKKIRKSFLESCTKKWRNPINFKGGWQIYQIII